MDKISRRSFLKSAGMTALAVAAVGMMTGCKGEDVVPDPQKVDVAVIFCQFGQSELSDWSVVYSLSGSKIQVVEEAAKEGQAVDKAEIEKLLADKKDWKLDETVLSDLKVHHRKDAEADSEGNETIDGLATAVKVSGLEYYVTVNVAKDKGI